MSHEVLYVSRSSRTRLLRAPAGDDLAGDHTGDSREIDRLTVSYGWGFRSEV